MQKNRLSRRRFLSAAVSLSASAAFIPARALGKNNTVSPSNRLITAMVGLGNRGNEILGGFSANPEYQIIGVCDCYKMRAEKARDRVNQRYENSDCVIFPQYEDALDRADIDLMIIATPDHWHSKLIVESCKAGKDVFCEKPLTLTLAENRLVVKAARTYNRIVSSGSQRVMEDYGYMAPVVASGRIGKVRDLFVGVGVPGIDCYLPEQPIPDGLDWDRWLGQAPEAPFNEERYSGSYGGGWRNYSDYGNGFLADWGAHKFGGALYAAGLDAEEPIQVLQPRSGENQTDYVTLLYANGVQLHHAPDHDITIVGEEAEYRLGDHSLKPLKTVDVRRYHGGATNIVADCAYCYKNRVRPFQDVLYGARIAAACQLFNIGYHLKRDLVWDSAATAFVNDELANRFVRRVQRAPYTIEC